VRVNSGAEGLVRIREILPGEFASRFALRSVGVDTALPHDAGPSAAGMRNRRVDAG